MNDAVFKMFQDRTDAGKKLAAALIGHAGKEDAIILALPRGGLPVAREVAKALSLPMDIWLVRKLGVPGEEELAMGAISLGGACYLNQNIISRLGIPLDMIDKTIEREEAELERRNKLYRKGKPPPLVKNKTVIIIDDGLATGATMHAAIISLRQAGAEYIVAAVPVGSDEGCKEISSIADEMICPYMPEIFFGVGQWYKHFPQISDEEVQALLG